MEYECRGQRERFEDDRSLALKMEEGTMMEGCGQLLKAGKENRFSPTASRRNPALLTADIRTFGLQNSKKCIIF